MAKKMGEQSWQTANRIAQQDLNTPLDSKGGFSEPIKEYLPSKKEKWMPIKEQKPTDYERVIYWDSRGKGNVEIGYFVWSQTPIEYVTHWMKLPTPPSA